MKERKERTAANLSHSAVCLMAEPEPAEPPMNAGRIYMERIEIDAERSRVGARRGKSDR